MRELDIDGRVVVEHALGPSIVERRGDAAGVSGQVVEVAQGDLQRGGLETELAAQPQRSRDLAGATGHHDRQGDPGIPGLWYVGVLEHERADEVGVRSFAVRDMGHERLVDGRVARREDRGIVDEAAPDRRKMAR